MIEINYLKFFCAFEKGRKCFIGKEYMTTL